MLGTQADFHFTLFNEKFYPQEFFSLTPVNLLLSLKYVSYFCLVGYFLQLKLSYYIKICNALCFFFPSYIFGTQSGKEQRPEDSCYKNSQEGEEKMVAK